MAVETITTGNLVADVEVRFTPNGKQVTELRNRGQPTAARTSRPASGRMRASRLHHRSLLG